MRSSLSYSSPDVIPVLGTAAMRAADAAASDEFGLPSFTLMETAARGAFAAIVRRIAGPDFGLGVADRSVTNLRGTSAIVFAGRGGNGGDGLAIARMLTTSGSRVLCITTADESVPNVDTRRNLALLLALEDDPDCDIDVCEVSESTDLDALGRKTLDFGRTDVCVDALLGIGTDARLREPTKTLAHWTAAHGPIVSIDLPTGIDSDTGECHDESAVIADVTLTMGAVKHGLLFGDGRIHAGDVELIDIGLPPHIVRAALAEPGGALLPSDRAIVERLPHRGADAHKFSVGQVLVFAGSDAYPGAAILACRAAARIGAGYVVCATSERAARAIEVAVPEVATRDIRRSVNAARATLSEHPRARAILIGPGLDSAAPHSADFVTTLLEGASASLVIDADGLNALATEDGLAAIKSAAQRLATDERGVVLTPHPAEWARLAAAAGLDTESNGTPADRALALSDATSCVVVLKGAPTVIAVPTGSADAPRIVIARDVHPAMATAGAGDVLAGMIAGLVAQGAPCAAAAVTAMHVGGAAVSAVLESNAARAMIASDMIEALPQVLEKRFDED